MYKQRKMNRLNRALKERLPLNQRQKILKLRDPVHLLRATENQDTVNALNQNQAQNEDHISITLILIIRTNVILVADAGHVTVTPPDVPDALVNTATTPMTRGGVTNAVIDLVQRGGVGERRTAGDVIVMATRPLMMTKEGRDVIAMATAIHLPTARDTREDNEAPPPPKKRKRRRSPLLLLLFHLSLN